MIKKILHRVVLVSLIISVLFFCFVKVANHQKETLHRRISKAAQIINGVQLKNNSDSVLLVGWSKANITPKTKTKIVGYGLRDEFKGVNDSLFVRTLVLNSNGINTAIISLDLLLVTPILKQSIEQELKKNRVDNVYFSATHTHNSFGGYSDGIMANFVLDGYQPEVFDLIVNQTIKTTNQSINKLDTLVGIDYEKQISSKSLNRITHHRNVNDVLRTLIFKSTKSNCNLFSANSHPTILGRKNSLLSNDYPGELINSKDDFSIFLAGTMGSLSPITPTKLNSYEGMKYFSDILRKGEKVSDSIFLDFFSFNKYNFGVVKSSIFLSDALELRPWIFNWVVGKSEKEIQTIRIGNLLMIALPCELSYEYYSELEKTANAKGLEILISTFNGSYLGYCTPSKHFDIEHMETREMNWIGKYGGDYFNEVIKMIIEKQ